MYTKTAVVALKDTVLPSRAIDLPSSALTVMLYTEIVSLSRVRAVVISPVAYTKRKTFWKNA